MHNTKPTNKGSYKNTHKIPTKKPLKSQRQLQIGEQIKRILAEIFIQDNLFSTKNSCVTILQADVSPDAKNAKIFIDIFGAVDGEKAIQELRKITPYLRGKLSSKINLRFTPELLFILDETSKEVSKIEELLNQESKKFSSEIISTSSPQAAGNTTLIDSKHPQENENH